MPPLDVAALERLAIRYVERFATTRAKLVDYLVRKIRARGWDGAPADPREIAERMASLGYIDDLGFGAARAAALARRGLGRHRVAGALRQAGLSTEDAEALAPAIEERALDAAIAFARRRRIGPFAQEICGGEQRNKQLSAMLRAGHEMGISRAIVLMAPGDDPNAYFETH
ncbi:MAG: regulatory protein RecX [Sphingomonas sp.]